MTLVWLQSNMRLLELKPFFDTKVGIRRLKGGYE